MAAIADLTPAELHARYYRWWTLSAWWCRSNGGAGIKLGPVTLFTGIGADERRRLSWTLLGGRERVLIGRPLDSGGYNAGHHA